jgi:hypothetical protein
MRRITRKRPSPAMIVAIVALVAALGGTAVAAGTISVGDFNKKTKQKTVGVGKLTYVTTTTVDDNDGFSPTSFKTATATCPSGTHVIGGGIKGQFPEDDFIFDSYPTSTGWSGRVFANHGPNGTNSTFTTTAICAASPKVTGAPPSS